MKTTDFKFEHKGYQCRIRLCALSNHSWFCGYVQLPSDHPDYSTDYWDVEVNCHGGLTYGSDGEFGFDCNHGGDTIEVQNFQFVLNEIDRMVDQFEVRKHFAPFTVTLEIKTQRDLQNLIHHFNAGTVRSNPMFKEELCEYNDSNSFMVGDNHWCYSELIQKARKFGMLKE